ncbi:MAG: aldo/keto reductase [Candidatus Brocadiia bacterium]
MQYGQIDGVDKPVSRLILGAMIMGWVEEGDGRDLLDEAFELGYNAFDTGHVYGEGVECPLGEWIEDRGVREDVVIVGKGAHPGQEGPRVNREAIRSDLAESLERLRTDYMDVYLLHRDDPDVPVGPIVQALNELLTEGRISAFGGSNWTHERIEEANRYAEEHDLTPFAASSPNYSLAVQYGEAWGGCIGIGGPEGAEARAYYRRTRMPVLAWSSLARGFLSGRLTSANYEETKDDLPPACVRGFCYEENFRRLDRAHELAAERGVSVPQIALAYVLDSDVNVFPLVGPSSPQELADDAAALGVELTEDERAYLDLRNPEV